MLQIKKIGLKIQIIGFNSQNIDKLSDKLHEELTKSFIDKKISILSEVKTRHNS